ncbi:MAG: nuclear transport factor 2 family protein [Actinomycetota bacterium]
MSQENVQIVRGMIELANARDVEGITALMSPDVECFPAADQPESEGFRGREAFAEYVEGWLQAFDQYTIEVTEFIDFPECVVAVGRVAARGRGSGAAVSDDDAWLYRFRDGEVVEYRECGTKARALEAAGLKE